MKTETFFKTSVVLFAIAIAALFIGCATLERAFFDRTDSVEHVTSIASDGTVISTPVTNTTFTVKPSVRSTLETAQTVNSIANPTPTAPLISGVLTAALAGLGWYARRKSTEATKGSRAGDILISAIETANNPTVKEFIAQAAQVAGVNDWIHKKVKTLTPSKKEIK